MAAAVEKKSVKTISGKGGFRPGSGRKKGSPNKVTAEIREVAREYGAEAVQILAQIMRTSDTDQARIAAAKELLDRGYGKSIQQTELSGTVHTGLPSFVIASYNDESNPTD